MLPRQRKLACTRECLVASERLVGPGLVAEVLDARVALVNVVVAALIACVIAATGPKGIAEGTILFDALVTACLRGDEGVAAWRADV